LFIDISSQYTIVFLSQVIKIKTQTKNRVNKRKRYKNETFNPVLLQKCTIIFVFSIFSPVKTPKNRVKSPG